MSDTRQEVHSFEEWDRIRAKRPWYVKRAEKIKWWFQHRWNWINEQPRRAKQFWQRGCRGWSDRDVWSVDGYLADIIPAMLKHLKDNKSGIPTVCFDLDPTQDGGLRDDKEGWRIARERWNAILDDIIFTFNVAQRVMDYDCQLCYDMTKFDEWYAQAIETWKDMNTRRSTPVYVMTRAECERYYRGWKLFQEHFFSLWD